MFGHVSFNGQTKDNTCSDRNQNDSNVPWSEHGARPRVKFIAALGRREKIASMLLAGLPTTHHEICTEERHWHLHGPRRNGNHQIHCATPLWLCSIPNMLMEVKRCRGWRRCAAPMHCAETSYARQAGPVESCHVMSRHVMCYAVQYCIMLYVLCCPVLVRFQV